ncbi:NUDIX domain-containing protein [bacterium]|nr:NUDIX domain-containing protein [bacterium]
MIISQCAAGVVIWQDHLLIVNQNRNSWSLPKGHRDEGEDLLATAYREISEETGLTTLDYILPLGQYSRYKIAKDGGDDTRELKEITVFLFISRTPVLGSCEIDRSFPIWVPFDLAHTILTNDADREFLISHRNTIQSHMVPPTILIQTTVPNEELALLIANRLVQSNVSRCVQFEPIRSIYEWHGQIEVATEWRLTIKSRKDMFSAIESMIRAQHPYDLPEIQATDISSGSLDYLRWIADTRVSDASTL